MGDDPDFPPHPFWDFSLKTYRGDVPAACLALQDAHGLDVNILLYALWRGTLREQSLDPAVLPAFLNEIAGWHGQVVQPLRAARRAARRAPAGIDPALVKRLHDRILQVEIACEHAEQLLIAEAGERYFGAASTSRLPGSREAARMNIEAYLSAAGVLRDDRTEAALATLLDSAFGSGS